MHDDFFNGALKFHQRDEGLQLKPGPARGSYLRYLSTSPNPTIRSPEHLGADSIFSGSDHKSETESITPIGQQSSAKGIFLSHCHVGQYYTVNG